MLEIEKLIFLNYEINNFKIEHPGIYGIIGQNGSGKSTFFSILNNETFVKNASIVVQKVMYISNLQSFDKSLSGIDYLKILSEKEYLKAIELSKKLGSDTFLRQKIGKYSLGMLQQFAIILSLSVSAKIIIFDEIYNGLDIKHQKIFFDLLRDEKKEKILILTSHYFEDLKENCDKTFFLNKNKIELVENFPEVEAKIIGEHR